MRSLSIALVFTEGVSLKIWAETGVVRRDSQLYEALCEKGHQVTFVTYGKENDRGYLPDGSRIQVLSRPRGVSKGDYAKGLAQFHGAALQGVDLIKSHQFRGARHAIRLARSLKRPILARAGYLATVFAREQNAPWKKRVSLALDELAACHRADAVCVPGEDDRDYLCRRYWAKRERVFISPNWVDTDLFRVMPEVEKHPRRICFVGRLAPQKQPLMLVEVAKRLDDIEMLVIGSGPLEKSLRETAANAGLNFTFAGRLPNERLPELLNSSSIFFLPTLYEGSPKSVYEAMACGLPVVSTRVPGVAPAIENGVEGFTLQPDDTAGMAEVIDRLLGDERLAGAIGQAGKRRVERDYSLDQALEREVEVYSAILGLNPRNPEESGNLHAR